MSPPITERLWHGGVPGLRPGDLITPGHRRLGITGCPICAGRDAGNTDQIDPPSRHPDKIYLTTSREYARFYAALSRGDLYRVSPVGPVQRSAEDTIATYMASSARVVAVYARAVDAHVVSAACPAPGVEGRRRSRRAGARERVMTAGSVDRLTRQRIVENHAAGVFPEWIASSLRVDPAVVRAITADYDAAHPHPDRRMTIDDRAARLTRAFTRAAAAIASALSELDALHADLAAARSDR